MFYNLLKYYDEKKRIKIRSDIYKNKSLLYNIHISTWVQKKTKREFCRRNLGVELVPEFW